MRRVYHATCEGIQYTLTQCTVHSFTCCLFLGGKKRIPTFLFQGKSTVQVARCINKDFIKQLKIVIIKTEDIYLNLLVPKLVQEEVLLMPYTLELLLLSCCHGQPFLWTFLSSLVCWQLSTFLQNVTGDVHINISTDYNLTHEYHKLPSTILRERFSVSQIRV